MEGRATKRYATLAALTLALGGAVFLNWSFAGRTPQAGTPEAVVQTSAEADEDTVQTAARQPETNAAVEPMTAQAVFDPLESEPQTAAQADAAEEMESGGQAGKNYGEAQLVSVSKDSGTEFFEQARLNRSRTVKHLFKIVQRDEALDAIKKTLKSADLSESEKDSITQKLQNQISSITVESSIESLIKSKGFADCVVSIGEGRADITVMTENDALTADEVTRIRDAVLGKCKGLSAQDITVVEVR